MKTMILPLEINPVFRLAAPSGTATAALHPFLHSARQGNRRAASGATRSRDALQPLAALRSADRWENAMFALVALCAVVPVAAGLISTGNFAANFSKLLEWVRAFGL